MINRKEIQKLVETYDKNKISIGKILSKDDFNSTIFPEEVKGEINDAPYYLLIFISREDSIKISCFPTHTQYIKKILIKLIEFTPDLVKGISTVLAGLYCLDYKTNEPS